MVTEVRRDFTLLEDDQLFLEARGKPWETIRVGQQTWVLLHDFDLPAGYSVSTAMLALLLPASYPDVQIDMAYFDPPLARHDCKSMNNLSNILLDGRSFQQWSRHRTPDQWRPGIDNLHTHVLYVTNFLEEELRK